MTTVSTPLPTPPCACPRAPAPVHDTCATHYHAWRSRDHFDAAMADVRVLVALLVAAEDVDVVDCAHLSGMLMDRLDVITQAVDALDTARKAAAPQPTNRVCADCARLLARRVQ